MGAKARTPIKHGAVGYNTLAAMEGAVGAPPMAKVLKAATGKEVESVVLRVDLDFAMKVRAIAAAEHRTITSVTRTLAQQMK